MIIAGLQKTTLIDYPGKIACVVFLAGCNFRCPWCYSSELVLPLKIIKQPRISEKEFFDFLRERQGLLEGVVICGGEPTINKELPQFIEKIKNIGSVPPASLRSERVATRSLSSLSSAVKNLGYSVKLDTNGSNPEVLKDLVKKNLIDYVAMDIKLNPKSKSQNPKLTYEDIMGEGIKLEDIKNSVDFLKNSNIDFEFRTTVVNSIHKKEDFLEIAKWIGGKNVKYYLQNFRAEKTIDPEFEKIKPFKKEFLEEIAKEISPYFKICQVRN